jgi:hypothetical protein
MKTLITLTCTALLAVATIHAAEADSAAHVAAYHKAGKALVEMSLTKKVNVEEATKLVDVLLKEGVWLSGVYAKAYPNGEKLLKIVTENVETMKKLSFDELEHQWHDLHYFDGKKDAIGVDLGEEDNEHLTDPIHVIVHPLLVLKAAQNYAKSPGDEPLKQMKEEMEEGIEQIEKAVAALAKK